MDKKYKLKDPTPEEQEEFRKGLEELLAKLSLTLTLGINKKGLGIKLENGKMEYGFIDEPSMMIQKKIEIVEVEKESNENTSKN